MATARRKGRGRTDRENFQGVRERNISDTGVVGRAAARRARVAYTVGLNRWEKKTTMVATTAIGRQGRRSARPRSFCFGLTSDGRRSRSCGSCGKLLRCGVTGDGTAGRSKRNSAVGGAPFNCCASPLNGVQSTTHASHARTRWRRRTEQKGARRKRQTRQRNRNAGRPRAERETTRVPYRTGRPIIIVRRRSPPVERFTTVHTPT